MFREYINLCFVTFVSSCITILEIDNESLILGDINGDTEKGRNYISEFTK